MSKRIWMTLVVLLLIFSFFGYFQFKKWKSFQVEISNNADMLTKIDVLKLIKYSDNIVKDKDTIVKNLLKGVDVPANIFLYTIDSMQKTTFFWTMKLSDKEEFERNIAKTFHIKNFDANLGKKFISGNKKWTILYNDKKAAFSYSFNEESVDSILEELLKGENTVKVSKSKFKDIKNKQAQIVLYNIENIAYINYLDGIFNVKANIDAKKSNISSSVRHKIFDKNNLMTLWLNADIDYFIKNKIFKVGNFKISGDSILKYYKNEIEIAINKPVFQKEEIVSYQYDENFEKKKIIEEKDKYVPGIYLWSTFDSDNFYSYLKRENIIDKDNKINRDFFPLYKVYVFKDKWSLSFSTNKEEKPELQSEETNSFFYLDADMEKLNAQYVFSPIYKYTKYLKKIKGDATKENDQIILNLDIELTQKL